MGLREREREREYDGSDGVDRGRVGDAAMGNDVVEKGANELPFKEEVFVEDSLLRTELIIFFFFYVLHCHFHFRLLFFQSHEI